MNNRIERVIVQLREKWGELSMPVIDKIRADIESIGFDPVARDRIRQKVGAHPNGYEIYRDVKDGFVLLAYSEDKGTYQIPHNHGNAWVLYVVISGEVEMKGYFNAVRKDGSDHLVVKSSEILSAGNSRVYYPGEIHDTRGPVPVLVEI